MMAPPERSPERDAALEAMLPFVALDGWTVTALVQAAGPDADLLFPGGAADLIEAYCDLADRWMEEDAAALDLAGLGLPGRVHAVIMARFRRNEPYKDAVRRAAARMALPGMAGTALRCTARTVDSIWFAAGDESADFSWYTKRAILTAIYSATVLFWLRDHSFDSEATAAFLERRLAGAGRIGRLRRRVKGLVPGGAQAQPS